MGSLASSDASARRGTSRDRRSEPAAARMAACGANGLQGLGDTANEAAAERPTAVVAVQRGGMSGVASGPSLTAAHPRPFAGPEPAV